MAIETHAYNPTNIQTERQADRRTDRLANERIDSLSHKANGRHTVDSFCSRGLPLACHQRYLTRNQRKPRKVHLRVGTNDSSLAVVSIRVLMGSYDRKSPERIRKR